MITKQLERLRRIEACLKHCDKIHLKEISRLLEVSEMTVRRDLSSQAVHDFPLEYYGGYIRRSSPLKKEEAESLLLADTPVQSRPQAPLEQAHNLVPHQSKVNPYISSIASDFIEMNDVVFFDNGPLIPDIIGSVPDHVEFTGVTASLSSFIALMSKRNCKAVLQGGDYQADSDLFFTPDNHTLEQMIFQKAFISASGIHDRFGITLEDRSMFNIIQLVLERSLKKYVIAEKQSYDQAATYKVGELYDFHYLICEQELPNKLQSACRESKLDITNIKPD